MIMKRIFFTLILMGIILPFYGQNFPGKNVTLLMNRDLKVGPLPLSHQKFGYDNFYKDKRLRHVLDQNKPHITTKYETLVGKTFKVVNITPYSAPGEGLEYRLTLFNKELQTVYFKYSPEYAFLFPFEVIGGIKLPEGFFCNDLNTRKDKFTGDTTISSPFEFGIYFMKIIKDNKPSIYMFVQESGSTLNVNKKGLFFILDNGQKIMRPNAKIKVKVNDVASLGLTDDYLYSALIKLTPGEINLLTNHRITDERLYIYDGTIVQEPGNLLKEYLKCLAK